MFIVVYDVFKKDILRGFCVLLIGEASTIACIWFATSA
jgi:hypothetical protein